MGVLGDFATDVLKKTLENYEQGQKQDQLDSLDYVEQAAENGDLDAIGEMALISLNQMDLEQATYWAQKGARVNDGWCVHVLGEVAFYQRDFARAEQVFFEECQHQCFSLIGS